MISPAGEVSVFATGLGQPQEIEFDSQGNLYAACYGSGTVRKITPDGTVSILANSGLAASLSGLAIDTADNVYVSNENGGPIRKITPDGTVSTYATFPLQKTHEGIDFDSHGNLLIATLGGTLYKVAPPPPDAPAGTLGQVSVFLETSLSAVGLAVDANDNVFVSNNFNGFYRLSPAGVDMGFWGGTSGSKHLAFNSEQSLLVADSQTRDGVLKKYNFTDPASTVASGFPGISGVAVWVPEPSGIALIGLGLMAATTMRRRQS